jgi:hypothetical protein
MGIRFTCPNGHKLHVKAHQAGKRGVCPQCGAKILIPTEAQAAQQPLLASNRGGPVASSVTIVDSVTVAASPSIVIATADSSVADPSSAGVSGAAASASTGDPPIAAPPPFVDSSPGEFLTAATPSVTTAQTEAPPAFIVPDATEPDPAGRYVAKRERSRRNQLMFAIVLLVAVIVLAGVLVVVLQRGAGSAPAQKTSSQVSHNGLPSRHVAVTIDRCLNAHSRSA